MKSGLTSALLLLVAALAFPSSAPAAERVSARTWRRVKVYDMAALKAVDPLPLRRIVGVRFHYRHERIRHLKPTWYQGSIWTVRRAHDREEFDFIRVMVKTADLEGFRAIPTKRQSQRRYLVYGETLHDTEAGFTFLRLLGTKVKRDAHGNAIVRW